MHAVLRHQTNLPNFHDTLDRGGNAESFSRDKLFQVILVETRLILLFLIHKPYIKIKNYIKEQPIKVFQAKLHFKMEIIM